MRVHDNPAIASGIRVIEYIPAHIEQIRPQKHQESFKRIQEIDADFAENVAIEGKSYTLVNDVGEIVAVGGVIPFGDGRASAWGIMSYLFPKYAVSITREALSFLKRIEDSGEFKSIIGVCDARFEQGHRWLRMLGFQARNETFEFQGNTQSIYERTKNG